MTSAIRWAVLLALLGSPAVSAAQPAREGDPGSGPRTGLQPAPVHECDRLAQPPRPITGPLPADFNVLFFGHFAGLDRERFLEEMAQKMLPGQAYETVVRDVYSLGMYLAHHKYPYLRLSYLFFLAGFVLACVVQGVHLVVS